MFALELGYFNVRKNLESFNIKSTLNADEPDDADCADGFIVAKSQEKFKKKQRKIPDSLD
jgi:hypothetical protein